MSGSTPERAALVTARDKTDDRRYGSKHRLYLPGDQIGNVIDAIRDVNHVDAGHDLEQLARDMGRTADTTRGHIDFARIGFGIDNELGNRIGRNRWIHGQDEGRT